MLTYHSVERIILWLNGFFSGVVFLCFVVLLLLWLRGKHSSRHIKPPHGVSAKQRRTEFVDVEPTMKVDMGALDTGRD